MIGLFYTRHRISNPPKSTNNARLYPKLGGGLGKCSAPERSYWTGPARGHTHGARGRHFALNAGGGGPLFSQALSGSAFSPESVTLSSRLKFSLLPIFRPQLVDNYKFYSFIFVKPLE